MIPEVVAEWLRDDGPVQENGGAPSAFIPAPLFLDFLHQIKVTPTPGQRVLAAVAYDGIQPGQLTGADRELFKRIFGDVSRVPEESRGVIFAVCGGRAGKSYVLSALRLLHLALTVPLDSVAPGEWAAGLIVAPDLRLARQTYRYVSGAIEATPAIRPMLVGQAGTDSLQIRRPDGIVSVECLPATRGGSAVRARSLVCAILDEAAFFRDTSFKVNDRELFNAVSPRILDGGQLIVPSTPYAKRGMVYEEFTENHGKPSTSLVAHAPTLLLRDTPKLRAVISAEEKRNPANARREFGAEFLDTALDLFFDNRAIEAAIDRTLLQPSPRSTGGVCAAGGDFGFVNDSSALVVCEALGSMIRTLLLAEVTPADGALKPSKVVGGFALELRPYEIDTVMADSHYRESITEHLDEHSLYFAPAPAGNEGKALAYITTRNLLHEGKIKIPDNPRFIQQLREVMAKPLPGGGLSIESPRKRARPGEPLSGGHGDLVSAWVLSVLSVSHYIENAAPDPPPKTQADRWRAREREREQRILEEERREREGEGPGDQDNEWIHGPA